MQSQIPEHSNSPQGIATPSPLPQAAFLQKMVHVSGSNSSAGKAPFSAKTGAFGIDLCWTAAIFIFLSNFFRLTPLPSWEHLGLLIGSTALYFCPQWFFAQRTLGQLLWNLQFKPLSPGKKVLLQFSLSPFRFYTAALLTTSHFIGLLLLLYFSLIIHPYFMSGGNWKMDPYLPDQDDWQVAPFFYTIGGWPKKFGENPIYYSLVYETAPPTRFVGHIVAHWENPNIRMILEGPKTPAVEIPTPDIRNCFSSSQLDLSCVRIRKLILERHLTEMAENSSFGSTLNWKISWFSVEIPLITARTSYAYMSHDQPTQGVYIGVTGSDGTQDRFVLINANGTQQTIILERLGPAHPKSEIAFDLFQKTLRTIRNFDNLDPGRAWVNRDLSETKLPEVTCPTCMENQTKLPTGLLTQKLISIQILLMSKISVDPSSFDAFFHLAGTSLLLAKVQAYQQNGISSSALQNLRSAYLFSKDLVMSGVAKKDDPRTLQIQNLWIESQKH